MLNIDQPLVMAFERHAKTQVMARIDRWLADVRSDWAMLDVATRQGALPVMLAEAQAAGMTCERDVAVFTNICVGLGANWRDAIRDSKVYPILSDEGYRPEAKLLWLGEVFHL